MSNMEGSVEDLQRFREQKEKEKSLLQSVDWIKENSAVYERIVSSLVEEYCGELDEFVRRLKNTLMDVRQGKVTKYSQLQLEFKCLQIATLMYEAIDGMTVLGSQSDLAQSAKKEKFDRIYEKIQGGTIPDKTAKVNSQLTEELLLEKIMARAHTVIGQKVKNANRLLEAIKKVLTSRMIIKEVFRKESPVYDEIDKEEIDEGFEEVEETF